MSHSTNRQVDPEIYFRIIHSAQGGHSVAPVATYREQTVEISLGPQGAFENGNIGALKRRAPPDRVLSVIPPGRDLKTPPESRTPRVVVLLRKAIEWQALLESGQIGSQTEIARQEGITRARVTQIIGILRLAPEIQEQIQSLPDIVGHFPVTERMLRPIGCVTDHRDQIREFHKLLAHSAIPPTPRSTAGSCRS